MTDKDKLLIDDLKALISEWETNAKDPFRYASESHTYSWCVNDLKMIIARHEKELKDQ